MLKLLVLKICFITEERSCACLHLVVGSAVLLDVDCNTHYITAEIILKLFLLWWGKNSKNGCG